MTAVDDEWSMAHSQQSPGLAVPDTPASFSHRIMSPNCLPTVTQLSSYCLPTVTQLSHNCHPRVTQLPPSCHPLSPNCVPTITAVPGQMRCCGLGPSFLPFLPPSSPPST
eukprot:351163-Chlamydomonas_euryale.AAC.5